MCVSVSVPECDYVCVCRERTHACRTRAARAAASERPWPRNVPCAYFPVLTVSLRTVHRGAGVSSEPRVTCLGGRRACGRPSDGSASTNACGGEEVGKWGLRAKLMMTKARRTSHSSVRSSGAGGRRGHRHRHGIRREPTVHSKHLHGHGARKYFL